jgi:23S rRNA pseudouridine1911/1915/1917 synthase
MTALDDQGQNPNLRYQFAIKIQRGFRHQIRCHLSWIGYPIVNDFIYGKAVIRDSLPEGKDTEKDFLALRAYGISFSDMSGRHREYRIGSGCDF